MVKRIERLKASEPSAEALLLNERSRSISDAPVKTTDSSVPFALLGTLFVLGWLALCFILRLAW